MAATGAVLPALGRICLSPVRRPFFGNFSTCDSANGQNKSCAPFLRWDDDLASFSRHSALTQRPLSDDQALTKDRPLELQFQVVEGAFAAPSACFSPLLTESGQLANGGAFSVAAC